MQLRAAGRSGGELNYMVGLHMTTFCSWQQRHNSTLLNSTMNVTKPGDSVESNMEEGNKSLKVRIRRQYNLFGPLPPCNYHQTRVR